MATNNPFDLLGDDDAEDPSLLIAKVAATTAVTKKATQAKQPPPSAQSQPAKLPSKPLPPTQAVKEARSESGRGGGRGGGRGYGRGRGGYKREESSFGNTGASAGLGAPEEGDGGKSSERRGYGGSRGGYRGGRRGGFANGDVDDGGRPRRVFERRSGTGHGNELKREGSGRGNWGTPTDELAEVTEEVVNDTVKNVPDEKPVGEEEAADGNKENPDNEPEEKEPEEKEMTLEEYEKLLEEKRKTLQTHKTEERKVDAKQFASMQPLSNKKKGIDDDVFIKLGSDKDKRKEASEKDEKSKKSVSINEFLKPAEGEKFNTGGRGRGRGRGSRGYGGRDGMSSVSAPPIEDPSHFPTLGGK